MIIGGIAVIARGVPRLTRDVDATIESEGLDVAGLIEHLRLHQLTPRSDDAVGFAAANHVLLLRHVPSGVEVDLSFASLPFELEALAAAEPLRIADVTLQVARPEDLIIYKAIAFRPQDQQDIERLVTLYASTLDMARIRETVRKLAAALDEPERLGALDLIVQRVGGLPPQGH
jgi:hypothetical protein